MGATVEPDTYFSSTTRVSRAVRCAIPFCAFGYFFIVLARSNTTALTRCVKSPCVVPAGSTTLINAYMGIVAAIMALAAIGIIRAMRIGITLDDAGATVRMTYSTKSFAWADIASARTLDRVSRGGTLGLFGGLNAAEPHIQLLPTITLTSGAVVRLYPLRMTVRSTYTRTWVDDALVAITKTAQQRRGGGIETGPMRPPMPR